MRADMNRLILKFATERAGGQSCRLAAGRPGLARQIYADERGGVSWIGLILFPSIIAMGMIVGLSTYRGQVLQQFGDASVALRNLRQTYQYEVQIDGNRNGVFTDPDDCVLAGSFSDAVDLFDAAGEAPACMNLTAAPEDEN